MFENRTIKNAKWIIGCKVVQSLLQLVVGMLSARYLGPSNYGLISYAASVVAFMVPVMQLGMRSTLVQEYVVTPEKEGQIAGTSLVLNLISGAACILVVTCFAAAASAGDRITTAVCAIYSIQLGFQALETLQCWFQAKLLSKYSSLAMLGAYVIVSAYKIYLLATQKSVYWFALSHSVEYCVIGIAMIAAFKKLSGQKLSFSWALARDLFSRSKYYIMANMMVMVFQNTDHVMLKLMVGDAENGFYTAAATCSGITYFVFTAILDTARPVVLEKKKQSQEAYEKSVSAVYTILIWLSAAQILCYLVLAKPLIWIMYGDAYVQAVPVLQILVWNTIFSHIGSVRNIWLLGEEKYNILWRINLCGAIANLLLNAVLIPLWGACGAALASVLTQFFTNVVMGFILKPIRANNRLMLKGLDPRCLTVFLKKRK